MDVLYCLCCVLWFSIVFYCIVIVLVIVLGIGIGIVLTVLYCLVLYCALLHFIVWYVLLC